MKAAGLIIPLKLKEYRVLYSEGTQLKDVSVNDITKAGVYYVSGYNVTDAPSDLGVLIVIVASWQSLQLYISNNNKFFIRILWSGSWSSWSTLN